MPWWLWGVLIVVGGWIVLSFAVQSIPEDPDVIFNEALAGLKERDREKASSNAAKLKTFPGNEARVQLIDGMMHLAEGRPYKAIKALESVVDDPKMRLIALRSLGNAYAQADDRWKAIEILESLVKEDETSDDARFSLAILYCQLVAWDEAFKHLNTLVDRKFQPENVRSFRAELYTELGDLKQALDDITEAIKAKPTDPGNGTKAGKVVMLAVDAQQLEPAEEVLEYLDQAVFRNLVEAEKKLAAGDIDQARTMAMEMRKENPLNLPANRLLAKVMLAYGTKEKALEGLALLRMSLQGQRNLELYTNVAALARLAEDNEYAALVQQNVDQLVVLNQDFEAKLKQVVSTLNDPQPRVELYNLAVETGRIDFAIRIVECLEAFYPDRLAEFLPLRQRLNSPIPQLVNTMSQSDLEKAAEARNAGLPPELQQPLENQKLSPASSDSPGATTPEKESSEAPK